MKILLKGGIIWLCAMHLLPLPVEVGERYDNN